MSVETAAAGLAAAVDDLSPQHRLQVAVATLRQVRRPDLQPQARTVLAALHELVNSGPDEHLDHLVSALEVCGPDERMAVQLLGDDHPVWAALRQLCAAIDQNTAPRET